jgi:hypothetical protein
MRKVSVTKEGLNSEEQKSIENEEVTGNLKSMEEQKGDRAK